MLGLTPSREGHFLLESGHHGNLWLDLDALFLRPRSVAPFTSALADRLVDHEVQMVCGPLTGGAFVAQMVAVEMDLMFCFTERAINASAEGLDPVEYGLPDGFRAPIAGTRVAVIDDAINAGSAVRGTLRTLRAAGAVPVMVAALLDLGESRGNPPLFDGLPLFSVATLPARLWTPAECPLCAARIPLDSVGTG
ncbi:MAG: orotate phosphoribosyltransferase [Chloroflexia bacterium]|nr:orotate phosphoribosyltransferase [Chloroflexia bacterium]